MMGFRPSRRAMEHEDLQAEITAGVLASLQSQDAVRPKIQSKKSFLETYLPAILIGFVLVASLSSCGILFWKFRKDPSTVSRTPQPNDTYSQFLRLAAQDVKVDALNRRVDVLSKNQWLLGLAFNNNSSVQEKYLKDTNQDASKLVILDEEWRLNRMPELLNLSDEDKQRIKEHVR
jgi:hypothetical protein